MACMIGMCAFADHTPAQRGVDVGGRGPPNGCWKVPVHCCIAACLCLAPGLEGPRLPKRGGCPRRGNNASLPEPQTPRLPDSQMRTAVMVIAASRHATAQDPRTHLRGRCYSQYGFQCLSKMFRHVQGSISIDYHEHFSNFRRDTRPPLVRWSETNVDAVLGTRRRTSGEVLTSVGNNDASFCTLPENMCTEQSSKNQIHTSVPISPHTTRNPLSERCRFFFFFSSSPSLFPHFRGLLRIRDASLQSTTADECKSVRCLSHTDCAERT